MGKSAPDTSPTTTPVTTPNPLYDNAGVQLSMNCSRWKVWDLVKRDPDFPKPRDIAGKNQWTQQEIEEYKLSRPRRIYAAVVALLAVVGFAAPFLTKILA